MGTGAGTYEFAWLRDTSDRRTRPGRPLAVSRARPPRRACPGLVLGDRDSSWRCSAWRATRKRLDPAARLVPRPRSPASSRSRSPRPWTGCGSCRRSRVAAHAARRRRSRCSASLRCRPPAAPRPRWRRLALAAGVDPDRPARRRAGRRELDRGEPRRRAARATFRRRWSTRSPRTPSTAAAATPLLQSALVRERAGDLGAPSPTHARRPGASR